MSRSADATYVPALRFRWLAPYYDRIVALTVRERTFKHALIAQVGRMSWGHVLDLGCGTGTLAIWMAQALPQVAVTGVDVDPTILAMAKRKARDALASVEFDCARSDDLPYAAASFDAAVSSLFFHHLSWTSKQQTAQELFRVLRPGAELHIADWGRARNLLMRALFVFIQLLDGVSNTRDNVSGRLIVLLDSAGFVDVAETQAFPTMFGTLSLYRARKPLFS